MSYFYRCCELHDTNYRNYQFNLIPEGNAVTLRVVSGLVTEFVKVM